MLWELPSGNLGLSYPQLNSRPKDFRKSFVSGRRAQAHDMVMIWVYVEDRTGKKVRSEVDRIETCVHS
jgi:hypothetical protein